MLVIVAPGQGAQSPGFLVPWLAGPLVRRAVPQLAEVAELDLVHFGTEADAETIRDTEVAQPLLVATALATLGAAVPDGLADVGAVSGHSVGELAAAGGSGAISADDAMVLVRERGRAMAEAWPRSPRPA